MLLIVATFLTAECTQYWQFLVCQGIAVGVGGLYVSHWSSRLTHTSPDSSHVEGFLDHVALL